MSPTAAPSPAEDQLHLANCFARKLQNGQPYDEVTFKEAYLETLPPTSLEDPRVSELWARQLWGRLKDVSAERFVIASKQPNTFAQLLYRVWGKNV